MLSERLAQYVEGVPAASDGKPERVVRNVARRVREARLAAGLTQEEAATRAHLPYKYWQAIERGAFDFRLSTLARVAKGLGVTMAELVIPTMGRSPRRKPGRPPVREAPKAVVKRTRVKKA